MFKSCWETTGGSSLVFNRLKAAGRMPADLENVRVKPIDLDICDAETLPVESLLCQSGYLTIKEVLHSDKPGEEKIAAYDTCRLAPPNLEIRETLLWLNGGKRDENGSMPWLLHRQAVSAVAARRRAATGLMRRPW